jgi:hypothetical protein
MTDTNETGYISFLQRLESENELKVIVGHTITNKDDDAPSIVIRDSGRIILLDTAMSRCWNNKNRKPCDFSNNLYNISFIVIEEDTITPKNKRALIDRVSSTHSIEKSSSSSSSSSPKRKTAASKRRGSNSSPKRKTPSSKKRVSSVPDLSSSSSSPTHSKNGGRIRSRNNRIRKYIIQK